MTDKSWMANRNQPTSRWRTTRRRFPVLVQGCTDTPSARATNHHETFGHCDSTFGRNQRALAAMANPRVAPVKIRKNAMLIQLVTVTK
jgi:hypothetical protein